MLIRRLLVIILCLNVLASELSDESLSRIKLDGIRALLKKPDSFGIDLVLVVDHVAFVVLPSNNVEATLSEEIYIPFGWSNKQTLTKVAIEDGSF